MGSDDPARSGSSTPGDGRRAFLITVDTEGDNLWAKPRDITTRNAETLPRFQELCASYGLRPTYLVNWEMATAPAFIEFGRAVLADGSAEIGMHLHAWNSPPLVPLTGDDFDHQPYLTEYPEPVLREKVKVMTETLEDTFGTKMVSHRGGRFGLNEAYVDALIESGYRVDCTVTPHVDWSSNLGDPTGAGGPDYRRFPETAYFIDPADIAREGTSPLLEVPLTVMALHESSPARWLRSAGRHVPLVRRYIFRALPPFTRMAPKFAAGGDLRRILTVARRQGRDHVELMLHSSELLAGGSPWFPTQRDVEVPHARLEDLFDASTRDWKGATLCDFHDALVARTRGPEASPRSG